MYPTGWKGTGERDGEATSANGFYHRGMIEPLFVAEHIKTLQPYIQKTVEDLLEAMLQKGCAEPVDLVEHFALPVPSYVCS